MKLNIISILTKLWIIWINNICAFTLQNSSFYRFLLIKYVFRPIDQREFSRFWGYQHCWYKCKMQETQHQDRHPRNRQQHLLCMYYWERTSVFNELYSIIFILLQRYLHPKSCEYSFSLFRFESRYHIFLFIRNLQ